MGSKNRRKTRKTQKVSLRQHIQKSVLLKIIWNIPVIYITAITALLILIKKVSSLTWASLISNYRIVTKRILKHRKKFLKIAKRRYKRSMVVFRKTKKRVILRIRKYQKHILRRTKQTKKYLALQKKKIHRVKIKPAIVKNITVEKLHILVKPLSPFGLLKRIISYILNIEFRIRVVSVKTLILLIITIAIYAVSMFYFAILKDIPSVDMLMQYNPHLTTTIYDRKGNVLYRVHDDEDRKLVALDEIPLDLINATIAIEDQNFYTHKGLSFRGITRAAKKTFFDEDLEGGSTITQQLVKNILLTPERTITRKLKEVVIATEAERRLTKNQILEMYLNTISYGGTTYGVRSAAKRYFGKDLQDLTLAESAFLAGLPAAPSNYSPFGRHPKWGKQRQLDVLARMAEDGYITAEQTSQAYEQKLAFQPQAEYMKAPHFVNYVISELNKKYGQMLVSRGGLEVFTSLDLDLQNELQKMVVENVDKLSRNNVGNGAALITNPKTGEILAMVGSVNYWDAKNDGEVNVTTSPRQPGSSIKPITYSLALENGFSPNSIIDDSPVTYPLVGHRLYAPVNYDGRFHGRVTLKAALANSYNVPAVKVLNKLGVDNLVKHGKKLGIATWNDSSKYGLSLTLGAGEVRMVDMAVAYGTFANLGYKHDLSPILKIYDPFGNILESNDCVDFLDEGPSILTRKALFEVEAQDAVYQPRAQACDGEKVLSETTAFFISHILSDNNARIPAFGTGSELGITTKQVAVKTGTTTNIKDNWAIGYTDDFVVVTWIGNNNGDVMKNVVSGYHGASGIWRNAFDYLIEHRNVQDRLSRPSNIVEVNICRLTNTLSCEGCDDGKQIYIKGQEPKRRCDTAVVRKIREELEKKKKEAEEAKEDDSK